MQKPILGTPLIIYITWAIIVFIVSFLSGGASPDNITHALIIGFIGVQIIAYPYLLKTTKKMPKQTTFIFISVIFACAVEGFYMLSNPVNSALKVTQAMPAAQIITNYLIDLAFTVPAYIAIFSVTWHFINKYEYKPWEYIIFIGLGQAIGDGWAYFFANPVMLLLIPYVMINYHAMNTTSYFLAKEGLKPKDKTWRKYIIPPICIILVYLIFGTLINLIGKASGIFS